MTAGNVLDRLSRGDVCVAPTEGLGWTKQAAYSGMGGVLGFSAAATVLVTGLTIKEPPPDETKVSRLPPLSAVVQTLRNRPFVQLLAAFIISSFSFALMTSLLPYYLTYQLEMEAQVSIVLLIMLGTVGLFLFPWNWVADRINKGPAYALGLLIASVAVSGTYFLPQGPTPLIYGIAFVAGLGFSAQWVFPWSMLPDVVEYDQKETGERREGTYYGVWALLTKFTNALGVAVSGWALDLFGYVPGVAQTEFALLGIRLFFGLIPSIILICSLPLLVWYPITKATHRQLRAELEGMQR
ncbi:MAG: MFS transporter [Anaerolineae bacterium]|nr:MFS transporter [Anaerolineae bacterium]